MASIKILMDRVKSITCKNDDNGGTCIDMKNGQSIFVDKSCTIIIKEDSNDVVVLIEI